MKAILSIIFILFQLVGHANTEYIYIDIKKDIIQLGTHENNWSFKTDKLNMKVGEINYDKINTYLNIKKNDRVLLYFHCLYGGVNVYHKNTVKKLKQLEGLDKVISLIWHTDGVNYLNSWNEASKTSELYKPILNQLLENSEITKYVLCHSMGHRIFEGLVKDYTDSEIKIKSIFFTGTDLEMDVFENSLHSLPSLTDRLVLYVHKNDRLLKKSRKSHNNKRLGIDGLITSPYLNSISNLERIDVTNSSGRKLVRLTNHIYFKRDKLVLKDMNNVINELFVERESYLLKEFPGVYTMK